MKKKDLILILIIIAAAVLIYIFISGARSVPGSILRISIDGETYSEYDLKEDRTIEIETGYGKNILVIENGSAYMKEADCPDKYCIDQGRIDHNSETIVCLPHRLVAEVTGEEYGSDRLDVDIIR
jgi:hypothetical protein